MSDTTLTMQDDHATYEIQAGLATLSLRIATSGLARGFVCASGMKFQVRDMGTLESDDSRSNPAMNRPLTVLASALFSICIPRTVETISSDCFQYCDCLSVVTFEADSSLSVIGEYAFSSCSLLESICLPQSIELLAAGCFFVSGLLMVVFESDCQLSAIGGSVFSYCSSLIAVCIPRSVEVLETECFCDSARLSLVTFEDDSNLSAIGPSAFSHCSSLSSICIPWSVETLSSECFRACDNLSDVTFEFDCQL
jgi:hypothetical protein